MSGESIRAEIAAALREASAETGDGTPLVATLKRPTGGAATPWATATVSYLTFSVAVVVGNYSQRMIDGTNIQSRDRKVIMEAGVVEPTTADTILIGTKEFAIVSVRMTSPAGVDLAYTLQCRA